MCVCECVCVCVCVCVLGRKVQRCYIYNSNKLKNVMNKVTKSCKYYNHGHNILRIFYV